MVKQKVKVRYGVKPAVELDLDSLAAKQGTLAHVLAEIGRDLGNDSLGHDLVSQRMDVELRSGEPGEVTEQALHLSDDWQTKVVPTLQAENSELGIARHVVGG
jgi:hypothetical protein